MDRRAQESIPDKRQLRGAAAFDPVKLEVFLPRLFSLKDQQLVQAFVEAQKSEYFVW